MSAMCLLAFYKHNKLPSKSSIRVFNDQEVRGREAERCFLQLVFLCGNLKLCIFEIHPSGLLYFSEHTRESLCNSR